MSVTRRRLIEGVASGVALLLVGGCKDEVPSSCTDTAGLGPEEMQARVALGYVNSAASADRRCEACHQYVAAKAPGACGGCKLLKGPIHPRGYCKSFAAKG